MDRRAFWYSALIAGAAMGVVSNLPLLNLVNCLLCIWIWGGGFLAVLLYRRFAQSTQALSPGQAAGLGAVAGVIGALIGVVVFAVTSTLSMPLMANVAAALNVEGDVPFASGDPAAIWISTLVFFVLDLVLYPIFGALAAFLTVSLRRPPPQPAA